MQLISGIPKLLHPEAALLASIYGLPVPEAVSFTGSLEVGKVECQAVCYTQNCFHPLAPEPRFHTGSSSLCPQLDSISGHSLASMHQALQPHLTPRFSLQKFPPTQRT